GQHRLQPDAGRQTGRAARAAVARRAAAGRARTGVAPRASLRAPGLAFGEPEGKLREAISFYLRVYTWRRLLRRPRKSGLPGLRMESCRSGVDPRSVASSQ